MSGRMLLIDFALVAVLVALVLVLSAGWAVVAIIALLVLLLCGISLGIGRIRGHGPRPSRRRFSRRRLRRQARRLS